jgi:hypothetical protein
MSMLMLLFHFVIVCGLFNGIKSVEIFHRSFISILRKNLLVNDQLYELNRISTADIKLIETRNIVSAFPQLART